MLSAGKFEFRDETASEEDKQKSTQKLVLCTVLKDAFDQIMEKNESIESIVFFND